MRYRIWKLARRGIPEGRRLPRWLIILRAILFPLEFIYWRVGRTSGYQPDRDVWLIDGIAYSAQAMRLLAESAGELYRIRRIEDAVWIEHVRLPVQEHAE